MLKVDAFYFRVVEDADPYKLNYENTAPVGNAVLGVPWEFAICLR